MIKEVESRGYDVFTMLGKGYGGTEDGEDEKITSKISCRGCHLLNIEAKNVYYVYVYAYSNRWQKASSYRRRGISFSHVPSLSTPLRPRSVRLQDLAMLN